jgi:serine/threonine-protein kinase
MAGDRERHGASPATEAASAPLGLDERRALSEAPAPGEVIASKYRVERVLGAGGMGVVVAAHHLQLDVRVAIKFLLRSSLENPDAVARFTREARAAARIANEHVARVLDVGTLDTGAPYIVMEFLEGSDLSARLQSLGPLPLEEAVECVLQACEALAEAHALGIIHRDLKPANLFWIRRPSGLPWIKVLDFGISKVMTASSQSQNAMTQSATIMGSPLYMSPEQMQSARSVDARTDIWALGVILHELLAGRPPFQGETFPEICINVAMHPPARVRTLRPDCPPQIEDIILRCLNKDPNNRFANVADLAVALLPFGPQRARASVEYIARTAQGSTQSVTPSMLQASPGSFGGVAPGHVRTITALGHTTRAPERPRRSLQVLGAIVVGVCVLLAGSVALLRGRPLHGAPASPGTSPAGQAVASPAAASSLSATAASAVLSDLPADQPPLPPKPNASTSGATLTVSPPTTPPEPLPRTRPTRPAPAKPAASEQPTRHVRDVY